MSNLWHVFKVVAEWVALIRLSFARSISARLRLELRSHPAKMSLESASKISAKFIFGMDAHAKIVNLAEAGYKDCRGSATQASASESKKALVRSCGVAVEAAPFPLPLIKPDVHIFPRRADRDQLQRPEGRPAAGG
jgi:hypothetical protein